MNNLSQNNLQEIVFNKAYLNATNNDYEKRIAIIWDKVNLLKEIEYVQKEEDKFSVAYRFMEIELEKVCNENKYPNK